MAVTPKLPLLSDRCNGAASMRVVAMRSKVFSTMAVGLALSCAGRGRAWLLALGLVALGNATATAATLKSYTLKDDGRVLIDLRGPIAAGDAQALKSLIKSANDNHLLVASVRLNSDGGALAEAAELASIIQFGKLATVVANGATCASACFVVFAAGNEKFVNYSSFIESEFWGCTLKYLIFNQDFLGRAKLHVGAAGAAPGQHATVSAKKVSA